MTNHIQMMMPTAIKPRTKAGRTRSFDRRRSGMNSSTAAAAIECERKNRAVRTMKAMTERIGGTILPS